MTKALVQTDSETHQWKWKYSPERGSQRTPCGLTYRYWAGLIPGLRSLLSFFAVLPTTVISDNRVGSDLDQFFTAKMPIERQTRAQRASGVR